MLVASVTFDKSKVCSSDLVIQFKVCLVPVEESLLEHAARVAADTTVNILALKYFFHFYSSLFSYTKGATAYLQLLLLIKIHLSPTKLFQALQLKLSIEL